MSAPVEINPESGLLESDVLLYDDDAQSVYIYHRTGASDVDTPDILFQRINDTPGAGKAKENLGLVEGGKWNEEQAKRLAEYAKNEIDRKRLEGPVTAADITQTIDDLARMIVAAAAGVPANSRFFGSITALRNHVQRIGFGAAFAKTMEQAAREIGIDRDPLWAAVMDLASIRAGYTSLHFTDIYNGVSGPELGADWLEYVHHAIHPKAWDRLQQAGFVVKQKTGVLLEAVAPYSWARRRRMQYMLVDPRHATIDELGHLTGIYQSSRAYRMLDEETVRKIVATRGLAPELAERGKFLRQSDEAIREALGIHLPSTADEMMKDGNYFKVRLGDERITIDGIDYYVMERPFHETGVTLKNQLYRSGTLRFEPIADLERFGHVTPEVYNAHYFEHPVNLLSSEANEPLFIEDPGIVHSRRQALTRRAVGVATFLHDTLAHPWYGRPALTAELEDWERAVVDTQPRALEETLWSMEETERHAWVHQRYALGDAGGGYYFVLRRTNPLQKPVREVVDMQAAFPTGLPSRFELVHTLRDVNGERRVVPTFDTAPTMGFRADGRLPDHMVQDLQSYATIKSTLNNATDPGLREGARKALLTRTSAVADQEVGRLLNDAYPLYAASTNRYRGIWNYYWDRYRTHMLRNGGQYTHALQAAQRETQERYGEFDAGAAAWGAFEWAGGLWSRLTISGWIATRVRDILGNFNTMALRGFNIFNPDDAKSLWQAFGLERGNEVRITLGGRDYTSDQLLLELVEHSIHTGTRTGSDLWSDTSIGNVMADDFRPEDMPFDALEHTAKVLLGRERVDGKWAFTTMKPGTALLVKNVIIPAAGGAVIGAATDEDNRLRGAAIGGVSGAALGTAFGAMRVAVGRANPLVLTAAAPQNPHMLQVYNGVDSGFGYVTRRVGAFWENVQKVAFYISMRKRGFSAPEAARLTHETIMDALSVAPGLLRARPFLPWMRWTAFNIPVQFRGLADSPRTFMRIVRGINDLHASGEFPDDMYVPSWIEGTPNVMVGQAEDGRWMYYILGNWIPTLDFLQAVDPTQIDRTAMGMLTPLLTQGFEQVQNRSSYFGRTIDKFADFGERGTQVEEFAGIPMKSRVASVLRTIRLLSELNRLHQAGFAELLESQAEHDARTIRAEDFNKTGTGILLTLLTSGMGVLPKMYYVDTDRNGELIVSLLKHEIDTAAPIWKSGARLTSDSAARAQQKQALNALREQSGFGGATWGEQLDYAVPGGMQELQDAFAPEDTAPPPSAGTTR